MLHINGMVLAAAQPYLFARQADLICLTPESRGQQLGGDGKGTSLRQLEPRLPI